MEEYWKKWNKLRGDMYMLKVIGALIISSFLLFIYCSCRIASESDKYMEDNDKNENESL